MELAGRRSSPWPNDGARRPQSFCPNCAGLAVRQVGLGWAGLDSAGLAVGLGWARLVWARLGYVELGRRPQFGVGEAGEAIWGCFSKTLQ